MLPLLPLAGFALAGIGNLIARRRQARAGMIGQAVNSQPVTPTNTVASAATSTPQTAQTPAGQANTGTSPSAHPAIGKAQAVPGAAQAQPVAPQQSGGDPNLAARLGAASVARSRRRNLEQQQAPLSGQAMQ